MVIKGGSVNGPSIINSQFRFLSILNRAGVLKTSGILHL